MKILIVQYEDRGDGAVLPSMGNNNIELILPEGVNFILVEKEEISPRTIYRVYGVDKIELGGR